MKRGRNYSHGLKIDPKTLQSSKGREAELYNKLRTGPYYAPNMDPAEYYKEPENVILDLKRGLDLFEIFGDRLLNIILAEVKALKFYTGEELNTLVKHSQSSSIWNKNSMIEIRARRQGKDFIPLKHIR